MMINLMRTFSLMLIFVTAVNNLQAQDEFLFSIPEAVGKTFRKKYPNVTEVSWSQTNKEYVAEFEMDKKNHYVLINNAGIIQKQISKLNKEELPVAVQQTLNNQFLHHKILSAEKLEMKGKVYYKLRLKGEEARTYRYFNTQGKMVDVKE